jgi:hypothetical protein
MLLLLLLTHFLLLFGNIRAVVLEKNHHMHTQYSSLLVSTYYFVGHFIISLIIITRGSASQISATQYKISQELKKKSDFFFLAINVLHLI